MAESIGDFFVNFFFKTDKPSAQAADATLQGLKTRYTGLTDSAFRFNEVTSAMRTALAPVRALARSIVGIGEEADKMNDFAMAVGTTVESLQRMQFVGEMAGASAEDIGHGMKTLSRELASAAGGSKESVQTFVDLGVSFKDAHGHMREVGQVMPDVIQKIAGLKTDGEKAEAAMKAFGKAGLDLLPMLKKSKTELAAAAAEFDAFGGGFNEKFVATAAAFGDNMDRARLVLNNMRREIAASVLPTLNRMFDRFLEWGKGNWPVIKDALNSFGDTVAKVFEGTAVTAIDTFIKAALQLFKDKEKWEAFKSTIEAVGLAFAGWLAYKNPVLAMLTALGLAIDDIAAMTQGKDSVVGRMSLAFKDWLNNLIDTHATLKGIVDFMKTIRDLFNDPKNDKNLGGFKKFGQFVAGANQATIGSLVDPYADSGANQQLDIKKQQLLDSLVNTPHAGKLALKLGLQSARTGAEVDKIANVVQNVTMTIQASPGMDTRELAKKIKEQIDQQMKSTLSDANDVLAPQGQ